MLVNSFNLSQSFNYAQYLFYKKRFKTEINCFCIRTLSDFWTARSCSSAINELLYNIATKIRKDSKL